ncbi:TetR family transcriptional regulator [Embleya scabrispora]|uniref:TetR family transcriptional regulator n=1 Tax=Embleya scabrispora TaxID=159449 RepID=A0A1T3NRE1_9ACTN|nr:TetR/AcrR family transcriptional regulator [Embleya scabrispora]OPC79314.1 TetR family transcriptional regulator [Embleya scabrispora]
MVKRGPYGKGEAKRREILRVALEVFAEEGYRGTSLRKVAARCDLSLPGLMHYFASKEDLLTQVLRARDEENGRLWNEYEGPDPHLEIVRAGARAAGLIELFVSMAAAGSDPEHPAHVFFAERYPRVRGQIREFLARQARNGVIESTIPPERLAALVLAVADGIQLQWLNDRSVDMEQALEDLLELIAPPRPE